LFIETAEFFREGLVRFPDVLPRRHARAKELPGLKKPSDPGLPVADELEEKLTLVTAVGQMPDLSRQIMPMCSRHSRLSC
jgi:hypothetical protein